MQVELANVEVVSAGTKIQKLAVGNPSLGHPFDDFAALEKGSEDIAVPDLRACFSQPGDSVVLERVQALNLDFHLRSKK